MTESQVKRVIKSIAEGVIIGVIYYIVFVVLIPFLLSVAVKQQAQLISLGSRTLIYIWFFIALGVAEKLTDYPIKVVLATLSKLLGVLFLYVILNGGIIYATIAQNGRTFAVIVDISSLLLVVILSTLIYATIDIASLILKKS